MRLETAGCTLCIKELLQLMQLCVVPVSLHLPGLGHSLRLQVRAIISAHVYIYKHIDYACTDEP